MSINFQISRIYFYLKVFSAFYILCFVGVFSYAQAPDPLPSSKVLELSTFATFTSEMDRSGGMDIEHPKDGTGRIFLGLTEGKVLAYSSSGALLGIFLDLASPGVLPDFNLDYRFSDDGLSFMAFHPDYAFAGAAGEGKFYTFYKASKPSADTVDYSGLDLPGRPGDSTSLYVLTEWTADALQPDRIDTSSRREVIRFEITNTGRGGHSVSGLTFNPFAEPGDLDYGLLYFGFGDMYNKGGVPDWQYVQDSNNPFGKILRINPLQSGPDPYSIPADNPFADGGPLLDDDDHAEEIYAWGYRNPQNLSFAQQADGVIRLVVFNIGADDYEEVELVDLADNHGWPAYDGPVMGNSSIDLNLPDAASLEFPAAVYDRSFSVAPGLPVTTGAVAIVGGFVVSDPEDPNFQNQLIIGDLPRGAFFHADFDSLVNADANNVQANMFVMNVSLDGGLPGYFLDITGKERGDVRYGLDESGRLFMVSRQVDSLFLTNLVFQKKITTSVKGFPVSEKQRFMVAPNPFNKNTTINYELDQAMELRFDVYDVMGRRVDTLDLGKQAAGESSITWGADLPSAGVFFLVMKTDQGLNTIKVMKKE